MIKINTDKLLIKNFYFIKKIEITKIILILL